MHGMAVASGPAGPVLAGPVFHSSKKKSSLYIGFHQCFTAWQRKSSKCSTDFFHAFNSAGLTRLETRYSGARDETNTHGMETGLTRAALLTDQSIDGDGVPAFSANSHFLPH